MSDLSQLLPVSKAMFSGEEQLCVNMRNVHTALGVGRDYSTWIKDRIVKFDFVEHEDYEKFANSESGECASATIPQIGDSDQSGFANSYIHVGEQVFGKDRIDYYFTLDAAKEIAMVENNDKGREVRRYFIACEKQLRKTLLTFSDPAKAARAWADEYERRMAAEAEKQKAQTALAQEQTAHTATKSALEASLQRLGYYGQFSGVCTQEWLYHFFDGSKHGFFTGLGLFLSRVLRDCGKYDLLTRIIPVHRRNGVISHVTVYHNLVWNLLRGMLIQGFIDEHTHWVGKFIYPRDAWPYMPQTYTKEELQQQRALLLSLDI